VQSHSVFISAFHNGRFQKQRGTSLSVLRTLLEVKSYVRTYVLQQTQNRTITDPKTRYSDMAQCSKFNGSAGISLTEMYSEMVCLSDEGYAYLTMEQTASNIWKD
jgi:hypothetical protein